MRPMTKHIDLTPQDIADALRTRRDHLGWSQSQMGKTLAQHGGKPMSGQAYSRFESGRPLKQADLEAALSALGITYDELPDWLPTSPHIPAIDRPRQSGLTVPVYGTPRFANGEAVLKKSSESNVIDAAPFFSGSLRAAQAPDNSMSPAILEGQFVFFDLDAIPRVGQLCAVELNNGTVIFRNYIKQDGSSVFLETLAPAPKIDPVPRKTIAGLYEVKFRAT